VAILTSNCKKKYVDYKRGCYNAIKSFQNFGLISNHGVGEEIIPKVMADDSLTLS
jgi:hypothetical protein